MRAVQRSSIFGLEWATRYYILVCFGPLPTTLLRGHSLRIVLITFYLIARLFGLSKLIYEILLCLGVFQGIHGPLDTFGYIEGALWGCGMLPYVACDILLLNPQFLLNVDKFFREMKRIHENTRWAEKCTGGRSASLKTLRFVIFSGCLDWFQNIFTFIAMQGTMTDKCHVYSVLPWKSPGLENFFWFMESFNLAVLFNVISMMTTLPGVWAYYLEEALNRLTDAVVDDTKRLTASAGGYKESGVSQKMLEHYRNLFYITREVNKQMGWGVMSFNTTNSIQQTAETYVIFQLLRAGASFDDVQFLFTDMTISASRVAHCFHAMGVVDGASTAFMCAIKTHFSRKVSVAGTRRLQNSRTKIKLDECQLRSFQGIRMVIGKWKCNNDFLLEGMSVYSDNYFTAALWP